MITNRKLQIFEEYNGFVEVYIFKKGDLPNNDFEINDWTTIDELIGNIILLKSGRVSRELRANLETYIKENTEDESVIEYLQVLASKEREL
jgi:hypothetical protein